jgi:hypothetical protein
MRRGRNEVGTRGSVVEAGTEVGVAAALPPLAQAVDGDPPRLTNTSAATTPQMARRIAAAVRLTRRRCRILPRRRWVRLLT